MPTIDPSQNLPFLSREILSGKPTEMHRYLEILIRDLQYKLELIANELNQKIDQETNTVDTFTPVVVGSTSAGTGTYEKQVGIYGLLGKFCWFTMQVEWDAANHTGTGDVTITGLPKTSATTSDANLVFSAREAQAGALAEGLATMAPNTTALSSIMFAGTASAMANDHTLTITGTYRTT